MYSMIPFGRMNQSWNDFFNDVERSFLPANQGQFPAFRTDIRDEGDHYLLEADLPGFQKEDIDLHLEDGTLTVTAQHQETKEDTQEGKYVCRERRVSNYARSFDVSGVQEQNISASYANGVLRLTLPKKDNTPPQSYKIAIQ